MALPIPIQLLLLLLTSLALLIDNGANSSYVPTQDGYSNSIAPAPSYVTRRNHRHHHHHHHSRRQNVFNVVHFGAKADGTDDHKAFKRAWKAACNSTSRSSVFLVPHKYTYLLNPVVFSGPCEAKNITVMIRGKLKAPSNRSIWLMEEDLDFWIKFRNISHLTVKGGGKIDGSGQEWWQNSCKTNASMPCVKGPTALVFHLCKHLTVSHLSFMDSQQMHTVFSYCTDVEASHLTIRAPEDSPNTDGIHLTSTRRMTISDCFIGTGDDCISIVNGSKNVYVRNTVCGPGHGISIGSLGAKNATAHVSNVFVEKATLIGTTNGVRIKTWQGGHGFASNIMFQDISMCNVSNPIIINQNYCDSKLPCYQQKSAVAVRGVVYRNIRGTSASDVSVNFNCSSTVPCRNIQLEDISLVSPETFASSSSCINVESAESGSVFPSCNRSTQL